MSQIAIFFVCFVLNVKTYIKQLQQKNHYKWNITAFMILINTNILKMLTMTKKPYHDIQDNIYTHMTEVNNLMGKYCKTFILSTANISITNFLLKTFVKTSNYLLNYLLLLTEQPIRFKREYNQSVQLVLHLTTF